MNKHIIQLKIIHSYFVHLWIQPHEKNIFQISFGPCILKTQESLFLNKNNSCMTWGRHSYEMINRKRSKMRISIVMSFFFFNNAVL